MLIEWEIELACIDDGGRLGLLTEEFHGWLFTQIQLQSNELADKWHQAAIKPFRIHLREVIPYGHTVHHGDRIRVSLTGLTEEAGEWLPRLLEVAKQVLLGRMVFAITEVELVRCTSFATLIREAYHTPRHQPRQFRFITPTVIRSDGKNILFPDPEKVFSSLSRRFYELSSVELPTLHADWNRWIDIHRYQLQTSSIKFSTHHLALTHKRGLSLDRGCCSAI